MVRGTAGVLLVASVSREPLNEHVGSCIAHFQEDRQYSDVFSLYKPTSAISII